VALGDNDKVESKAVGSGRQRLLAKPLVKILLAIIICAGLILSIVDIRKILNVAQRVEPLYLGLSFVTTILSYLFIGLALKKLLNVVDHHVSFKDIFAISWASTSLNYLVSTGGVGGLTMRIFLLRKRNISFSETFVVSFVHTLLINGVLIAFVLFGFGYLLTNRGLRLYQYVTSGAVLGVTLFLSFLAAGSVVDKVFRDRFIDLFYRLINRIYYRLRKRALVKKDSLIEFKEEFHQGISLMLAHKKHMVIPLIHVFMDWLCALLTLYFSFFTVGYRISPDILVVGFAIGIFVSLISFIPGAIGIMEGSMAAIYYSLGVPLEIGIIGVLLYRLIYFVFPFVTSTLLYYPLLKEARATRQSGKDRV